jgi:hypothetical protein
MAIIANTKYTARYLVEAAGLDPDVFGEVAVEIGGIKGIVTADHEIRIAAGTTELEVRVGDKYATVPVNAE